MSSYQPSALLKLSGLSGSKMGRPAGLALALLALLAARPGRAQLYNVGDAGAYGGVLY